MKIKFCLTLLITIFSSQNLCAQEIENLYIPYKINLALEQKDYKTQKNRYGSSYVTSFEIQQKLLSSGQAFYYPMGIKSPNHDLLIKAEKIARDKKIGIWRKTLKNFIPSSEVELNPIEFTNSFRVVYGRLTSVTQRKKHLFLNFGNDWKTDFTIQIEKTVAKKLLNNFDGLNTLMGNKLTVRGWIEEYNGPMIKITNPLNIEFIRE